ncbi:MAG: ABC transporter permease [Bacteriovoracaceae bacterium]|nr:ABC transporter permease [Bacteriovoracaceae bacterium]
MREKKKARGLIEGLGRSVVKIVDGVGKIMTYGSQFFYWVARPPYRWKLLFEQLYFIGNKSMGIILLAGSFTGMVMAYQVYFGFQIINVDSLVGVVTAISLTKELAPVITGLIVAGRAGAAMAAQIGTMKVTEQVDSLEVMGVDSFQYLAVPRIIATTIAMPMLTAMFNLFGNIGSWWVGTKALMIDETIYFSKIGDFMSLGDLWQGLIKATFFGFIISIVGTYYGFSVTNGAEGVGKGTNLAVVWGMILVLVSDYFLTSFLIRIL